MRLKPFKPDLKDILCRFYPYNNNVFQVGFDQLGGTDEFSTDDLEERLAKSQVISFDGESSVKPGTTSKRSVRQSETSNGSDSD